MWGGGSRWPCEAGCGVHHVGDETACFMWDGEVVNGLATCCCFRRPVMFAARPSPDYLLLARARPPGPLARSRASAPGPSRVACTSPPLPKHLGQPPEPLASCPQPACSPLLASDARLKSSASASPEPICKRCSTRRHHQLRQQPSASNPSIWPFACNHKNRALPILPWDSRWVLIGDGGDVMDTASPFLVVLRRRSSCRIIRPLPSFLMVQIHHLPELVGDRTAAMAAVVGCFGW
ncbi:hypothetical protein ACLOJK_001617 [Asimina triloba]